jgi:alpha-beta hydrolase superfamily lysophospholipase
VVELHDFAASDGYTFRYRKYPASGARHARVVCIHGIQSHGGWYERSCERLAAMNYETYFLDRRGSGLNAEKRGDCPSFRRLLDDIKEFIQALPKDTLKTFLVCVSWGGKLGVGLQYRAPGLVDGLALLCPGIAYRVKTPFLTRWQIANCWLVRPRKTFPIPLNDPNLFTASEKWRDFLRDDPLALRQGTARLLAESVLLGVYLKRARKRVTVPTLLMLAGKDQIVNNAKVRRFVEKFPAADKTVVEYPEAEHTLEFEPEGCTYLDDLIGWLGRRSR